jgi:hypothetical protein
MPTAEVPFPLRGGIEGDKCVVDVDFLRGRERESGWCPNIL